MRDRIYDPYDFSLTHINNVPVYYKDIPGSQCVYVNIIFNVGAFDDPVGKEGLAHFVEHLVFDGSDRIKSKKGIDEWSKKDTLNSWNGSTDFASTCYYFRCFPEKFKNVFSCAMEMSMHPAFRKSDIELERKIITQENIKSWKNKKYEKHIKRYLKNVFNGHEHSRFLTSSGWSESIQSIQRADIINLHQTYYRLNNCTIVLTGAVDKRHFKSIAGVLKQSDTPENLEKRQARSLEINQPSEKLVVMQAKEIGEQMEQSKLTIERLFHPVTSEEVVIIRLGCRVLRDILNNTLREEKGICYNVDVGCALRRDFSLFYTDINLSVKDVKTAQTYFAKLVQQIKRGSYKTNFIDIKRNYLEEVRAEEYVARDILTNVSDSLTNHGSILTTDKEKRIITHINFSDFQRFVQHMFDSDYMYTEIIYP